MNTVNTAVVDVFSMDAGRHLFVLHLHVEMLKIINIVWCRFQDFKLKVCFNPNRYAIFNNAIYFQNLNIPVFRT